MHIPTLVSHRPPTITYTVSGALMMQSLETSRLYSSAVNHTTLFVDSNVGIICNATPAWELSPLTLSR